MSELSSRMYEPTIDCGSFIVRIEDPQELRDAIDQKLKNVPIAAGSFSEYDDALYESQIGIGFDAEEEHHTVKGFVKLEDSELIGPDVSEVKNLLDKYIAEESDLEHDAQQDSITIWTIDGIAITYKVEPFGHCGAKISFAANLPTETPEEMSYEIICNIIQEWGKLHGFAEWAYDYGGPNEPREIVIPRASLPKNALILWQALLTHEQWCIDMDDARLPWIDHDYIDVHTLAKEMLPEHLNHELIVAKLRKLSVELMETEFKSIVEYDLRVILTR